MLSQASPPVRSVPSGEIDLLPVHFRQLRAVARLQQRAFSRRLAYRYSTLVYLWFHPRTTFLIARAGNDVIGCAIGDQSGRQSRVINLCVDPDVRRSGIGTSLLRRLEQSLPAGDIVLMAEVENHAARSLYKKEGYVELGVVRNYYGRGKDGVWMQKARAFVGAESSGHPVRDF